MISTGDVRLSPRGEKVNTDETGPKDTDVLNRDQTDQEGYWENPEDSETPTR